MQKIKISIKDEIIHNTTNNISNHTLFQSHSSMVSRWLEWQCNMISEVQTGIVFTQNENNTLEVLASWSNKMDKATSTKLEALVKEKLIDNSISTSKLVCSSGKEQKVCDVTILPLHYNNHIIGAITFLQNVRSEDQKKAVLQLFKWGSAWLESSLEAAHAELNKLDTLIGSVTEEALENDDLEVCAHNICTLLDSELGSARVNIGLVKGLQVQTLALSNQLRFDKRSSQLRDMESAMEEAVDQEQTVVYPKLDNASSLLTHKHQVLSKNKEDTNVLSIPITHTTKIIGVLLLIREKSKPFTEHEISVLEHVAKPLGSIFTLKLRDEASMSKVFFQKAKQKMYGLFGARHLKSKFIFLGLITVFLALFFYKTNYYTYGDSTVEGAVQQMIVAPQNGFIKSATVRAGDKVEKGQVLVYMDEGDIKLEYEQLLSKQEKIRKEYQEALALRKRAKVSVLSAQIKQVEVGLNLLQEKRNRCVLKAPFTGFVVSGDLSQSLGAPVDKGDKLFQITPLGDYRVIVNIDDYDVSKIKIGQEGSLRLSGLPYDPFVVHITRITPVSEVKDGGNYFRIEASIDDANNSSLRPGMQGITKVNIDKERLIWVWTHALVERLRLWFWSVGI